METSSIEQLYQLRYKLLKWFTIGWAVWFGTFILKDVINNSMIRGSVATLGLIGSVIWIINLLKLQKLGRTLRLDNKLHEALNDELYQFNMHKSILIGYFVVITTTAFLYGISQFLLISGVLAMSIILYFGVLSVLIAGLIYNRD